MVKLGLISRIVRRSLFASLLGSTLFALGGQAAHAAITDIVGTYTGPWRDVTFQTTGTATIAIGLSGNTAQFDVLITGDALGGGTLSIPEQSFTASVVGGNIVLNTPGFFSGLADLTGTISGTDGTVSVSLGNFNMAAGIQSINATGRIANGTMHIDYTINIDSPGSPFPQATGTLDAALVPEPGAWALIAAGIGWLGWRERHRRRSHRRDCRYALGPI